MHINLTSILLQPGTTEDFKASLDMESFENRMGSCKIIEKTPVELTISHTSDGILEIDASCSVSIEIPCSRCLKSVKMPFELRALRTVNTKLSEEERVEALDESNYIEGKDLDVDILMYNEILIDWPMQVLCKEECKGICSNCGANRNLMSCDCDTVSLDPRMAAISDIFSKFKEV